MKAHEDAQGPAPKPRRPDGGAPLPIMFRTTMAAIGAASFAAVVGLTGIADKKLASIAIAIVGFAISLPLAVFFFLMSDELLTPDIETDVNKLVTEFERSLYMLMIIGCILVFLVGVSAVFFSFSPWACAVFAVVTILSIVLGARSAARSRREGV